MKEVDIFTLEANIAHAGTDQRNVHIVARECAKQLGFSKPIAIHHHLIQGLLKPDVNQSGDKEEVKLALKMSKSKPDSAVFIHDSPEEIKRKVNNAYAPEGTIELNPILDWVKHLVFYNSVTFTVNRPEKWGGDLVFNSYTELEKAYVAKELHPMDLKNSLADWLIEKLEPARKYFEDPKRKVALEEIENLTSKP